MDLSIIIVSYNTKEILRNCLNSVRLSTKDAGYQSEIIVVDNGSKDESAEMVRKDFPDTKLIKNTTNLGFARANNIGIKASKGKYTLLLNSDTVIFSDVIPKMIEFMKKNPKVGVSTCRVELENGKLDPACHRGFPTPWASFTYFTGLEKIFPKCKIFGQYHQTYKDLSTLHEIDSCSGAFYFIRRRVIEDVGLLDEDYFIYGEDLDWSYRIKQKGWKIYFNPNTKILHLKKRSGRYHPNEAIKNKTTEYFYDTMELFYNKNLRQKYPWFITKLVMLGIKLKSGIK